MSAELFARLERAMDEGRPDEIAEIVDRHWSYLIRTDAPLLIRAVRAVGWEVQQTHPAVCLVQEILSPIRPMIVTRDEPLLARAIEQYAGLADPRARVGVGLVATIALTRRGRFAEAAQLGERVADLGLELLDPGYSDGASVAALELHTGIAYLMTADLTAAERHLAASYRNVSPFANHAQDAAGKLGFLYALRGESHLAATWLERSMSRESGAGEWLLRATERQAIAGANMLLAADRLDWPEYHRHSLVHDMSVPSENWMYVMYARARAGLFLGNQRILIDELHDFRAEVPLIFTTESLPRMLLDTAEMDLLLTLGDLEAARAIAERLGDHPLERTAMARFQLAIGEPAAAEETASEARWPVRISRRVRLNLLLLGVTADQAQRLGSEERSRLLRRVAVETANEIEPWLFTMAINDPAATELLSRLTPELRPLLDRLAAIDPPRPFRLTPSPAQLTPRERVLLQRLAAGDAGLATIAAELHVSPATIRNQRKSLYRKLGARSRAHAVEIALRNGLLEES